MTNTINRTINRGHVRGKGPRKPGDLTGYVFNKDSDPNVLRQVSPEEIKPTPTGFNYDQNPGRRSPIDPTKDLSQAIEADAWTDYVDYTGTRAVYTPNNPQEGN